MLKQNNVNVDTERNEENMMSEKTFSYYQYRKDQNYAVFIRFENAEFEKGFVDTLGLLGFDPVERDLVKDIELDPKKTVILRVVKASARISKKIHSPEFGDHRYGKEQVSLHVGHSFYCYQGAGMMIYNEGSPMWELALNAQADAQAIRAIFTRFLSFALKDQGVIGFWGVPVEEGMVILSPKESNFESIFIDVRKQLVLTFEGAKELSQDFHILRLDSTLQTEMRQLSPEQLLSFLSQRTTYISPMGMRSFMKADLWELAQLVLGYIYPASKFQPRSAEAA